MTTAPSARGLRLLLPLGLALAAALSVFHVFDWLSRPVLSPLLDAPAEEVASGFATRAGAAFAVSKAINAALSFAEEVTVTGDAVFVEASARPAALLRPISNLVDQFARIMLIVAASALLIEVLLHFGAGYGTGLVLALPFALFACTGSLAAPPSPRDCGGLPTPPSFSPWSSVWRCLLALGATGATSARFLADRYRQANAGLEVLRTKTDATADVAGEADSNGWTASCGRVKDASPMVSETFDDTFHDVATLITVFLQTVHLPLLLVLALWRGLTMIAARDERAG